MAKVKPYIDDDGEVRDLDDNFFANATRGRPPMPEGQKKKRVNLMLDPDVIEALKKEGNMSASVNQMLRGKLGL